jgi:hydroxymethylpyrimidine/phosphomethylpyrimidine kinase
MGDVDYPRRVARDVPVVLTIAGSDPSGGAGIQADLATFAAFGVHGASVVTALTAQNRREVRAIAPVVPAFVGQQLDAVLDDLDVAGAKTGMLHRAAVVEVIVDRLRVRPLPRLVVDPVFAASTGAVLLEPAGIDVLRRDILPLATVVTPNLAEAEVLTGRSVRTTAAMRDAARALVDMGAAAALVKGGHLPGDATDVLYDGHDFHELSAPRIGTDSPHGTGCTLSAALAASLALGLRLEEAVSAAKRYVTAAIANAPSIGGPRASDPSRPPS